MPKLVLIASVLFGSAASFAEDIQPAQDPSKQALASLQSFIGQWRGVGQPQRGSTRGAWVEEAVWEWQFSKEGPSVRLTSPKSKMLIEWEIRPAKESDRFQLVAKKTDSDETESYEGGFDADGKLVFVNKTPHDGFPARISVRLVAENKRMVVLYERKFTSDRYFRMAELGLTRKGSGFGKGTSFVECVVTGGQGTIAVTYEGKTYYVCCGGCRDHFNDDPATVLAEYRERKKQESEKTQ
jgi:YHS domain-containing protein